MSSHRAGIHTPLNNRRVFRREKVACISARLDQHPDHRLVAPSSGHVQRRLAAIHRFVQFRARFDQRSHHSFEPVLSGDEQRRSADINRLVDGRARLDEHPYYRQMIISSVDE